jgi:hypothetical protein
MHRPIFALRFRNKADRRKREVFMPITKFTAENWPESATEFRRALQEAWRGGAPIDDFVQLVRDLTLLEQKHGLSSAEFYERYQRGEMGDEVESMRWASKFEIYEEMKEDLDKTFSLLEQYALPVPV